MPMNCSMNARTFSRSIPPPFGLALVRARPGRKPMLCDCNRSKSQLRVHLLGGVRGAGREKDCLRTPLARLADAVGNEHRCDAAKPCGGTDVEVFQQTEAALYEFREKSDGGALARGKPGAAARPLAAHRADPLLADGPHPGRPVVA